MYASTGLSVRLTDAVSDNQLLPMRMRSGALAVAVGASVCYIVWRWSQRRRRLVLPEPAKIPDQSPLYMSLVKQRPYRTDVLRITMAQPDCMESLHARVIQKDPAKGCVCPPHTPHRTRRTPDGQRRECAE